MNLKELQKKIQSKSKGSYISIMSDSEIASEKEWIKTPSYDLNRIISGSLFKGLPSRSMTILAGPEASFKSSFTCLCMAEAQKNGYTPVIIDSEGAWTGEFVSRWGLDPKNILHIYDPFVDNINVMLGQLIDSGDKKMIISVDSIGGLETNKLLDDAMKGDVKADQGQLQKKIKRMLKLLLYISKRQDSIIIGSAHYYGNPNAMFGGDEIGGGKFVKLAPDIIIGLKKTKIQGEEKKITGNLITAITLKNRFYPAFNQAHVEIDYINGINKMAGMVDLAIQAGFIDKGGAWYTNKVTGEKFQGEKNAVKCITSEVLEKLDNWIKDTGYSTENESVKMANEDQELGIVDLGEENEGN